MEEYYYEDDPLNHRVKLIKDSQFGKCFLHSWDIPQELADAYLNYKTDPEITGRKLDLKTYVLRQFKEARIIPQEINIIAYDTSGATIWDGPLQQSHGLLVFMLELRNLQKDLVNFGLKSQSSPNATLSIPG